MSSLTDPKGKPNDPIKLRPHHGLCTAFFVGMGYSDEFTENMRSVIDTLNGGAEIILTDGADAICGKCPKNIGGVCDDRGKTERYDRAVIEMCGVGFGDIMDWQDLSSLCREKITAPRRLSSVCGDCKWYYICGRK